MGAAELMRPTHPRDPCHAFTLRDEICSTCEGERAPDIGVTLLWHKRRELCLLLLVEFVISIRGTGILGEWHCSLR